MGFPYDGDPRGAWCALRVEAGGSIAAEIRRFDFDREATIRGLERLGPMAGLLARRLHEARYRV